MVFVFIIVFKLVRVMKLIYIDEVVLEYMGLVLGDGVLWAR